jgi:hypothetical protein
MATETIQHHTLLIYIVLQHQTLISTRPTHMRKTPRKLQRGHSGKDAASPHATANLGLGHNPTRLIRHPLGWSSRTPDRFNSVECVKITHMICTASSRPVRWSGHNKVHSQPNIASIHPWDSTRGHHFQQVSSISTSFFGRTMVLTFPAGLLLLPPSASGWVPN